MAHVSAPSIPAVGFLGHHDESKLPIRAGQEVVIPKGITIRSFHPKRKVRVSTRAQRVRVHHVLGGMDTRCLHVAKWDRGRHPGCEDLAYDAYCDEVSNDRRSPLRDNVYDMRAPISNPEIVWAGEGSYWCWADINDVLGLTASPAHSIETVLEIIQGTRQ
jgi:hypothetical protein